ncbi:HD domain-containing protein, partial [Staphylococcus aureus]|uniref:HD domain-containing protein n=1 Tax=Staphylococcus aureus TaxID=1280 RepID=UPI003D1A1E5A
MAGGQGSGDVSLAGLGVLADGLDETESAAVHAAADFAREKTCDAVTGHDWWHVVRVTRVALMLADVERADRFVVNLAALLHDVDDHKVSGSFETGAQTVRRFLDELGVSERNAAEIAGVVAATSFRGAG